MPTRKKCSACKKNRLLKFFNRKTASPDGLQNICRECNRAQAKRHYESNKETYKERSARYKKEQRIVRAEKLRQYLLEHPCVDCGEPDPIVLEFDHVRGVKKAAIGTMLANGVAWSRIRVEMKKCDVRCANCHRRRTARDQEWHALLMKAE